MNRIAIMGANGFIGKNLMEYLKDKYLVFPITRDDFSLLDENKVKNFIENNKIDVIIHCANEGGSRRDNKEIDVVKNNLKMFFNLERCLNNNRKLITFGSGAQYNKSRDLIKVKESSIDEFIPKDAYGYSKYVISKYCKSNSNIYNLIIFGLFGKYEDYTFKFISNAILKNLLHMPIVINQNVVFDYLFLDDFLEIIEKSIENDFPYNEFNITPNKSIDLLSIAHMINECSEFKSDIIVNNPGYNYEYTGDNARLNKNIPDFKFTEYNSAVQKLYKYYRDNLDKLNLEAVKADSYINLCKTR